MAILKVTRGDTWRRAWIVPLTLDPGTTARLHLRDGSGNLVAGASEADGRLLITAVTRRIDLRMPHTAMGMAPGVYWYDLEVTVPAGVSYPDGVRQSYGRRKLKVVEDFSRD